jgi:acetyl-CoA carboxylase biotin carboxyl carrier protein
MKLENVKKFIDLAKSEGVAELKYEEKDLKISVNFMTATAAPAVQYTQASVPTAQASGNTEAVDDGSHKITSPFVGTYYGQPAPGKPNYIKVGDKISKGQTLCILEAMKIMNEIESDVSGEVIEICIDNESLVEFGQTLFKVRV